MMGLTPMQAKTLAAIQSMTRGGVSPTFRDLQTALGLASLSSVHRLVHGLKDRGAISFEANGRRCIAITPGQADQSLTDLTLDELRSLAWRVGAEIRRRGQ